jgi:hypothetical protein
MKRIIMMLALTALLVVALSMSALSAFANPGGGTTSTDTQCKQGNPNCATTKTNGSGKVMTTGTCGGCDTTTTFKGGKGQQ